MINQTSLQTGTMELLVSAHRQQSSIQLRNQIVRLNLGLVYQIADCLARQSTELCEDLEPCNYQELMGVIEQFNPDQGCAFSSFAVPYIRGETPHSFGDCNYPTEISQRWQQPSREGQKLQETSRVYATCVMRGGFAAPDNGNPSRVLAKVRCTQTSLNSSAAKPTAFKQVSEAPDGGIAKDTWVSEDDGDIIQGMAWGIPLSAGLWGALIGLILIIL